MSVTKEKLRKRESRKRSRPAAPAASTKPTAKLKKDKPRQKKPTTDPDSAVKAQKLKTQKLKTSSRATRFKTTGNLQQLLKKHPSLEKKSTEFGDKIVNAITGHEIKCDLDTLVVYLNTKNYRRAVEKWYDDTVFEKYLPYVVPNKKDDKKLFCKVTKRKLNKIPAEVEKHVNGKNYKRQFKELIEAEERKKELEKKRKEKAERFKKRHGKKMNGSSKKKASDGQKEQFELAALEQKLGYDEAEDSEGSVGSEDGAEDRDQGASMEQDEEGEMEESD